MKIIKMHKNDKGNKTYLYKYTQIIRNDNISHFGHTNIHLVMRIKKISEGRGEDGYSSLGDLDSTALYPNH